MPVPEEVVEASWLKTSDFVIAVEGGLALHRPSIPWGNNGTVTLYRALIGRKKTTLCFLKQPAGFGRASEAQGATCQDGVNWNQRKTRGLAEG